MMTFLMDTTPATLLERVRDPGNQDAWQRFVELYTPLLHAWAKRAGLQAQDAADLVQEVLVILVQQLRDFRYDRQQSFRSWLRTVLLNKWREIRRRRAPTPMDAANGPLAELAEPDDGEELGELAYQQYLVGRALQMIEGDLEPATLQAWQRFAVAGEPAADVASELGISTHAVYLAKARVLRRLRQELSGLLDE